MKIGALAREAQVNIQTVRYYERIGVLRPVGRKDSGYRVYNEESLRRLLFIRRGQELGFSLDDLKELLSLHASTPTGRQRAREKAKLKISAIREKIASLKKIELGLRKLVKDCEGRALTSPCPILDGLDPRS